MAEPLTTALSLAVAKKSVERLVDDIYDTLKDRLGSKLKYLKAANKVSSISKSLRHVQFVKTIWQVDREVDLFAFYYPSRILLDQQRVPVSDLSQLPCEGNAVVQGTVGQGKSIFFRYLTCQELLRARAIPVFFELRKLKDGDTLVGRIIGDLRLMGFDCNPTVFEALAEAGKITLFLDAFDEVAEGMRPAILAELQVLSRQFPSCRILVSARPESGIQTAPGFRVLKLAPLEKHEYKDVLRHLCDRDTARAIISGVEHAPGNIADLLTTPLMVTLLTFRYRIEQSIPSNAAAFYKDLFSVLLQRHDKSKPGYSRPRKSAAADGVLHDLFDALSFVTRKTNSGEFSATQLRKHCKQAMDACGEKIDADKFIDDIVEITCLIAREGSQFRFIHKSVQEYHAASFISSRPDESALTFYNAMAARWTGWREELYFLEQIDEYRCGRFFVLPQLLTTMGVGRLPTSWRPSTDDIIRVFGDDMVGWSEGSSRANSFSTSSGGLFYGIDDDFVQRLHVEMYHISAEMIRAAAEAKEISPRRLHGSFREISASIEQLMSYDPTKKAIERATNISFSNIWTRAQLLSSRIQSIERSRSLFEF